MAVLIILRSCSSRVTVMDLELLINFLPLGDGNVLNCVGIVPQPPFQFHFTVKVTVTIVVWRQFWLWFQPDQVNVWFLHHLKAYVKNGKLSTPISIPNPNGAGASDARNNIPEIAGIVRATIAEYFAAFFSCLFEKVMCKSPYEGNNYPCCTLSSSGKCPKNKNRHEHCWH